MSDLESLADDLLGIYTRSGREVTYVTDRGETRPYWPNRFLQALKRAIADGDSAVLDFAVRLVQQSEPSRGFHYLADAGRLDISVEALVADSGRPYHDCFPAAAVAVAQARLEEYGYQPERGRLEPGSTPDGDGAPHEPPDTEPVGSEPVGVEAVPVNTSWGSTLRIGNRVMTLTGLHWYLIATAGLRPDQVADLDSAVLAACGRHAAPQIGGNHVLEALLETGLYQRVWPGAEPAS